MAREKDKAELNNGPVWRDLLKVSAPMSLGILGVLLVGLADAFFLARVGQAELAAVGFIYPVIVTVSAFAIGISAGANAALSQARGRDRREEEVGRLALHATLLGLVVGCAVAILLWQGAGLLFSVLGARGEVLDRIGAYIPWWAASFPVLILTMILNAAYRAAGDGARPATIMVLTAVLNVGLTPLLIFGWGPVPALGMAGAGLSTFAARLIAGLVVLGLATRSGLLSHGGRALSGIGASLRGIARTGLPAAASRAVNPAGMALVTMAVSTLGDAAVAGFGAAARVQAIVLVPFFAIASGLSPVVGQAWGADLAARARAATRIGTWFALVYGLGLAVTLWAFANPIAEAMTASGEAARFTAEFLRIVSWSLGGYGLVLAANAALTARSRATWAMGLSLLRIGAFYVPLAWLGVTWFDYTGVLVAAVVANLLAAWAGLIALRRNALSDTDLPAIAQPAHALTNEERSHG